MNTRRRTEHSIRVKTGCITWIRKVKCDETKPACKRCMTTGRACDGYASIIRTWQQSTQRHTPDSPARSTAISIWRHPTAGFLGTRSERHYFQTFRVATEAGVAVHVGNVSSFWTVLAPRLAHHNTAVRHAVIALGATYQFFKASDGGSKSDVSSRNRAMSKQSANELELFIIRQYNLAISELRSRIESSPGPETSIFALVCCLVFVCLENLRFNHHGAIAHLNNGVKLILASFDLKKLFSPVRADCPIEKEPVHRIVSNDEIKGVISYFRHLEITEHLFSYDVPLNIASILATDDLYDDGSSLPKKFKSLEEAHQVRLQLTNDVMGRDWQMREHRSDSSVWSIPAVQRQLACLRKRASTISDKYEAFLTSREAPTPKTREFASSCLDMVQVKCMQAVIEMTPVASNQHRHHPMRKKYISEVLHYTELLQEARELFTRTSLFPLDFTTETGIIAPAYFSYVYSLEPESKLRARKIMENCGMREGPWDGRSIVKVIQASNDDLAGLDAGQETKDSSQGWGGNVDPYQLFSALKVTDW